MKTDENKRQTGSKENQKINRKQKEIFLLDLGSEEKLSITNKARVPSYRFTTSIEY